MTIDFNEVLNYALRSQLSYTISQPGWYLTERVGWRTPNLLQISIKVAPLSKINTLVEVDDANKIQWIAIRGSSNLENWLLDFEYIQRPFTEIYQGDRVIIDLHRGFHQAADDVCKIILPHLNRDYNTRITGHSLGGAIAAILTILLAEEGYQIEKCITFGQPRVTNKQGAQKLQHLPLLRVINDKDIVPLLPPNTILTDFQGGYEHFGAEIILESGNYSYFQQHQSQGDRADSFWTNVFRAVAKEEIKNSTENIKDHNLLLYLANILSNLESGDPALESVLREFVS